MQLLICNLQTESYSVALINASDAKMLDFMPDEGVRAPPVYVQMHENSSMRTALNVYPQVPSEQYHLHNHSSSTMISFLMCIFGRFQFNDVMVFI